MTLGANVNSVMNVAFNHIKNIVSTRTHMTQEASVTLVHAHVMSILGYCNVLLNGLSDKLLYKV